MLKRATTGPSRCFTATVETTIDNSFIENDTLGLALFLVSGYRPPEIISAIASDRNRGSYLATSRRAGMLAVGNKQDRPIIFDESGASHLRRDVYYTPDYALSSITYDPSRNYRSSIVLSQVMGATFASDPRQRIVVDGTGYYANRATSGITGTAVSIIARDRHATAGGRRPAKVNRTTATRNPEAMTQSSRAVHSGAIPEKQARVRRDQRTQNH